MKAGADFQKTSDSAIEANAAGCRFRDSTEHFEQRRFSGPVAADNADDFAGLDVERNVLERPDGVRFVGARGLGLGVGGVPVVACGAVHLFEPPCPFASFSQWRGRGM